MEKSLEAFITLNKTEQVVSPAFAVAPAAGPGYRELVEAERPRRLAPAGPRDEGSSRFPVERPVISLQLLQDNSPGVSSTFPTHPGKSAGRTTILQPQVSHTHHPLFP